MIKLNSQIKGTANFSSWKLPLQAHRTRDRTKVAAERWRWLRMMHTKCFRTSGICLIEQTWWWSHTSPHQAEHPGCLPSFPLPAAETQTLLLGACDTPGLGGTSMCLHLPPKTHQGHKVHGDPSQPPAHTDQYRPLPRNALLTEKKIWAFHFFSPDPCFSWDMKLKQLNI